MAGADFKKVKIENETCIKNVFIGESDVSVHFRVDLCLFNTCFLFRFMSCLLPSLALGCLSTCHAIAKTGFPPD